MDSGYDCDDVVKEAPQECQEDTTHSGDHTSEDDSAYSCTTDGSWDDEGAYQGSCNKLRRTVDDNTTKPSHMNDTNLSQCSIYSRLRKRNSGKAAVSTPYQACLRSQNNWWIQPCGIGCNGNR